MRTLRLSLAGTVILMLLGGLGSLAAAQDDELAATHVIGKVTSEKVVTRPTYTVGEAYAHNTGYGAVYEEDIDWSDPRLPSLMRHAENWDFYYAGDVGAFSNVGALPVFSNVRLEGPDGAWTGMEYGLMEELAEGAEGYPQTRLMFLSGEGAYEGLSAVLERKYEKDAPPPPADLPTFEGYILEGGLPPTPEAPEPFAE